MRPSLAIALLSAAASVVAQTQTKVDVTIHGLSVKRSHPDHSTKVSLGRGGVGIVRTRASEARGEIKVSLDGDPVLFEGQGPIMRGGTALVPLRGVFEKMGASLQLDPPTNRVTATRNGKTVVVVPDKPQATVDGKAVAMHQPPILLNGRVLVPLRFLSESFGAQVLWKPDASTVAITSGS